MANISTIICRCVHSFVHITKLQNKCVNFKENLNFQEYGVKSTQSTSNRKKPTEDATTLMETYLQLANNPGENLCFVNTNLQILRSLGIFHGLFSSRAWNEHPERRTLAPILTELELVFSSVEASAEKIRLLVATASEKLTMASGDQQDILEFLNLMLREMEKELTALGLSNTVMEHFKMRDKIVKKFLHGQGAGVCPNCHHVPAEQYDNFSVLRLPVPRRGISRSSKTFSLSQLILKQYSEEEQQPMKCPTCCRHEEYCPLTGKCSPRSYTQQRVLIKSPNILLVQLMRFDANSKLFTKVNAEDILELPNGDKY